MSSPHPKQMRSARRSDRAQRPGIDELEALAKRLRAVRDRAGVAKDKLKIGIVGEGKHARIGAETQGYDGRARLTAKTAEDVFDSFEHPDQQDFWEHRVWRSIEPDDLREWFKETKRTKRGSREEQPTEEPAPKKPKKPKKPTAGSYAEWAGGYYRMPNVLVDTGLMAVMPLPALRAYLTCYRYAGVDGSFYISHAALAQKIGCRARQKGADAMKRLVTAGLVKIERRGNSAGRATDYRLVALNGAAIDRAKRTFMK